MQQFKTHQTQTRHYNDNPPRYHPLYVTNKHKHESEAGLLHLEKAKPLERNWFCSLTFEDKEIVGEVEKWWVSRLSPDFHSRFVRDFVSRVFVACVAEKLLCWIRIRWLTPPLKNVLFLFFLLSSVFLPLETTCTCFHSGLVLYLSALWGAVLSVQPHSAQPVDLQALAASIGSHMVPVRLTARRAHVMCGRWRVTSVLLQILVQVDLKFILSMFFLYLCFFCHFFPIQSTVTTVRIILACKLLVMY